nr:hypothetical protein [Tanacetum cinerariifolium]
MWNIIFVDLRRIRMTKEQSAIFTAVASLFFWQWQLSSLAVETSSASGNSITGSRNSLCILFPTRHFEHYAFFRRGGKLKLHGKIFASQSTKGVLVFATLRLCGRTLWDVQVKGDMSWDWRKILQLQDIVRPFIWVHIAREGFTLQANVADLVENGAWTWPLSWLTKAPNLGLIIVPNLDDSQDCVQWRDHNGNMVGFSIKLAWETLRPKGLEEFKMQDMLRPWDVEPNTDLSMLRLFKDTRRPPKEIRDLIMVTVRLNLISFRFNNTLRVQRLLAL